MNIQEQRAHRMCVHQTLAPGTPSNPGMPTSPYGQHNIHTVAVFSVLCQQCELWFRSGDTKSFTFHSLEITSNLNRG